MTLSGYVRIPPIRFPLVTHFFLWFVRSQIVSPALQRNLYEAYNFSQILFFPLSADSRCDVCRTGYVALFRYIHGMVIKKLTFLSYVGSLILVLPSYVSSRPGINNANSLIFFAGFANFLFRLAYLICLLVVQWLIGAVVAGEVCVPHANLNLRIAR